MTRPAAAPTPVVELRLAALAYRAAVDAALSAQLGNGASASNAWCAVHSAAQRLDAAINATRAPCEDAAVAVAEDDSDYMRAPRTEVALTHAGVSFIVSATRFRGAWHIDEVLQRCKPGGRFAHRGGVVRRRVWPRAKPGMRVIGLFRHLECDLRTGKCEGEVLSRAALAKAGQP